MDLRCSRAPLFLFFFPSRLFFPIVSTKRTMHRVFNYFPVLEQLHLSTTRRTDRGATRAPEDEEYAAAASATRTRDVSPTDLTRVSEAIKRARSTLVTQVYRLGASGGAPLPIDDAPPPPPSCLSLSSHPLLNGNYG